MSDMIASQPPGQVFPWPKGTRLVAIDDVIFAIPAAVLRENEQIGSVIIGDTGMELKLPTVSTTTPGALIYIRLRSGMTVSLTRSCQAVVVSEDKKPRRIRVIPSTDEQKG